MSNDRAREWLRDLCIAHEEEPEWVSGQKPDFFCKGPPAIWVEVKALGHEERFYNLGDAHVIVRDHMKNARVMAHVMVWAKAPLAAGDAKVIAKLASRETNRTDFAVGQVNHFVVVPELPAYGTFARFSFDADDGTRTVISAVASANGKYGWPAVVTPKDYRQKVEIRYSDGTTERKVLREITTFDDNVRVAAWIRPGADDLSVSTAPVGAAAKVNTVDRIRSTVSEANSQHKNGCRYHPAAALTIIYHDDVFVAEDNLVTAALYGDLAYTFPANDFQNGQLVLTQNGVFGPGKNTTTSAIGYVRNNQQWLFVHNAWAERPLPRELFPGRHVFPKPDGTFQVVQVLPRRAVGICTRLRRWCLALFCNRPRQTGR